MKKTILPEALSFYSSLAPLAEQIERAPHLRTPLASDLFIFHLSHYYPDEVEKSKRLMALIEAGIFTPETAIPMTHGAEDPLMGLAPITERPVEFAIGQFLASQGAAHWERVLEELLTRPEWLPCFERPMAFTQLEVLYSSDYDQNEPFTHFQKTPAFASIYLRQEAERKETESMRTACLRLADRIDSALPPHIIARVQIEKIKLDLFGEIPVSSGGQSLKSAQRPIR